MKHRFRNPHKNNRSEHQFTNGEPILQDDIQHDYTQVDSIDESDYVNREWEQDAYFSPESEELEYPYEQQFPQGSNIYNEQSNLDESSSYPTDRNIVEGDGVQYRRFNSSQRARYHSRIDRFLTNGIIIFGVLLALVLVIAFLI